MLFNHKYNNYSDAELINIFLESHDMVCIGVLYQRYGHLVLGVSLKYLKNKMEAQDATMQVFSNLADDLKKHKVSFFKSWLYVYTKNYCLMQLRKRQNQIKRDLELRENNLELVDFNSPEHLIEKEKQISLLEIAIESLNDGQKRCIRLFYFSNKSYHEITEITGYGNNDVKSYIQNGKRNIKLKMEILMNEQTNG